ncbi:hypothetical protein [Serratia proteamaculans]|uniref:hypothetical protein n=1 Tax=Serratia proteamaculans TaxID=28151 RepID=UPI00217A93F4|nr:hypothetical protein [Serratia proteamaculans]CAI1137615.1 Uncharacterised protein [Serratia proteamaculans]CAI1174113.1 Uncharacterised protein [Serratia proteamaculans]
MSIFKFILIQVVIVSITTVIGYFIKDIIKYSSITEILSGLQNASAMVFAIAGIWLAYLYPNAIAGLIKNEKVDFFASRNDAKRVESMVFIIVASALVLIGVISFYVVNAIFKGSDFYLNNKYWLKSMGVGYVLYLYVIQVFCVLMVVFRNISFVSRLHAIINDRELDDNL